MRHEGNPLQLVAGAIKAITASPDGAPVLVVVDDARLLDNLSALVFHQLVLRRAATVTVTIRTGAPAPDAVAAYGKTGCCVDSICSHSRKQNPRTCSTWCSAARWAGHVPSACGT